MRTLLKLLAGAVAACAACGDGGGPALVEIEAQPVTRETVRFAWESDIDLVVLGTDVRPGSDRLFLGPRVERILEGLRCPALVVNAS